MKNTKVTELMSTDVNNLRQKQFDALKQHGIDVLQKVIELLRKDKYDEIIGMTFYSPAGDDMGRDNMCIDFDWTDVAPVDIDEYIKTLTSLSDKQ